MRGNASLRARVIALASGAGIGQLAVAVSAPVISRVYDPTTVGHYSAWFAAVAVAVAFASLRWEYAIPSATPDDRGAVLLLAMLTIAATSLTIFGVTVIRGTSTGSLLIWLAPAVLLQAVYQCTIQWSLCRGRVAQAGYGKATHGLGQAGSQTLLGLFSPMPGSLALGYVLSSLFGVIPALRGVKRMQLYSLRKLIRTAKSYWRTSFWVLVSGVMNTLGTQAPILIIASFSAASAGQFALGIRSATAPMVLLGIAIAQVFLSQIATGETRRLGTDVTRVVNRLFPVTLAAMVALAAAGASIAKVLLGEEWTESGGMLQILSPALLLIALSTTVSMIPISLGHARGEALYQAMLLASRLAAMAIGGHFVEVVGVVIGYTLATVLCLWAYLLWCFRLASASIREAFRYSGRELLGLIIIIVMGGAILVVSNRIASPDLWVLLSSLLCLTPLAIFRWRTHAPPR